MSSSRRDNEALSFPRRDGDIAPYPWKRKVYTNDQKSEEIGDFEEICRALAAPMARRNPLTNETKRYDLPLIKDCLNLMKKSLLTRMAMAALLLAGFGDLRAQNQFSITGIYRTSLIAPSGTVDGRALLQISGNIPMQIQTRDVDPLSVFSFGWEGSSGEVESDNVLFFGTLGADTKWAPGSSKATISKLGFYLNLNWTATNLAFSGYMLSSANYLYSTTDPAAGILANLESPMQAGMEGTFSGPLNFFVVFNDSVFVHAASVSGSNAVKEVSIPNNESGVVLDHGTFRAVADLNPPKVTISSPKSGAVVTNDHVTLVISATDDIGLAPADEFMDDNGDNRTNYFQYVNLTTSSSNDLLSAEVAGTSNVSLPVPGLVPGTNRIRVLASDYAYNQGSADVTLFYSQRSPIQIVADSAAGRVSGVTNQQLLELGKNYSITAVPKTGKIFYGWYAGDMGNLVTQSMSLTFMMTEGLVLTAQFVDNPFIATAGNYSALFMPTGDGASITPGYCGALSLTLTSGGSVT